MVLEWTNKIKITKGMREKSVKLKLQNFHRLSMRFVLISKSFDSEFFVLPTKEVISYYMKFLVCSFELPLSSKPHLHHWLSYRTAIAVGSGSSHAFAALRQAGGIPLIGDCKYNVARSFSARSWGCRPDNYRERLPSHMLSGMTVNFFICPSNYHAIFFAKVSVVTNHEQNY